MLTISRSIKHIIFICYFRKQAICILLIFFLALVPRVFSLGNFITIDEYGHWFPRSEKFLVALQSGTLSNTIQGYHPGVTTMWAGSVGILAKHLLHNVGVSLDFNLQILLLRLPSALINTSCLTLGYVLLCRLISGQVALLAALFWATNPFLIAHSRILHTDALHTSFILLALLAALVAFHIGKETASDVIPDWRALQLSGITSGLAILTRLIPSAVMIICIMFIIYVGSRRISNHGNQLALKSFLLWSGLVIIIFIAAWPALWSNFPAAVNRILWGFQLGKTSHEWGNFFWGEPVGDPGLFFYPVAIILRMTPWSVIGLLVIIIALAMPVRLPVNRRLIGLFALFVLLFISMLSIADKKFDRYILPVFPVLDFLAAVGWIWLFDIVQRTRKAKSRVTSAQTADRRWVVSSWCLIILVVITNLVWYHPYYLSYYNPLLGGGTTAQSTLLVGWGEGMKEASQFIASQPDGCNHTIASWRYYNSLIAPYACTSVVDIETIKQSGAIDYAIVYINQRQRNLFPLVQDYLTRKAELIHVVRIHGIDYAYVYRLPSTANGHNFPKNP